MLVRGEETEYPNSIDCSIFLLQVYSVTFLYTLGHPGGWESFGGLCSPCKEEFSGV